MLLAVLAASAHLTPRHVFEPRSALRLNLSLALVLAEAAVFYLLMAVFRKQGANVYLCAATACVAIWQLLAILASGPRILHAHLRPGRIGALDRLSPGRVGARASWPSRRSSRANALMSLSFVAAALLTLSRMAARLADPAYRPAFAGLVAGRPAGQPGVLSLLAAWLVRHPGWRRWYVVTAITEAALMFLAIHVLSHLSRWEELEIFAVAAGIGLLAVGHVGWYREEERQEDMVSFSLGDRRAAGGRALGDCRAHPPQRAAVLALRTSWACWRRACCCWPPASCSRSAPRRLPGPGCWRSTWRPWCCTST